MARVLVIGGDAAGMSAAAALRRRLPVEHEVVVLERGEWTSYSACGIPYWVSGEVTEVDDLVARSPAEHRANGIDLRTGTEAVSIDLDAREVETAAGDRIAFDALVIATGAEPVRPDLPGIHGRGILGVQTLGDGQDVIDALAERPRDVVVVGSGYVGLEMAEACVLRGCRTTVVERAPVPLSIIEPVLGEQVAVAMRGRGIELRTSAAVSGFDLDGDGHVRGVRVDDEVLPADLVLLGLGVTARSALAVAAGLPTGVKGGIVTDARHRVAGADRVWAAGDCVETRDRTTGLPIHLPLGTHANKQGMVVADDVAATLLDEPTRLTFPGVVQTAITKFCALEISRTGLGEQQAREAGFDPVVVSIETSARAGYMPDAGSMTVLLVADRGSRRLLGVQVVGTENAGLRVDAAATALTAGMTVDDVVMLDLAYAPPFASVWSPVQVAARAAVKAMDA
ncbi:pyridine nucleotide-disulfide oxidoreductase [Aeromicrobium marinum DSM 15272]|uniref:Pyridine nucleotide-disulfide oxidoreductase n=1 Tax=Aeromicrobium marinum DSM 15272 TaxID=585531 RepID=E2SFK5_9ACTN|nr:FAD-dependent oxidoreductase [Aeromicrobium marinum]EFQ82106.1 pyridine nucleotide-disulfide oxidoreductase [Aeromicrobium marinum DSM 15272]